MDISGFVNDSRNKCQLSGYPIGVRDGTLLLRQNKDLDKAIPIRVRRDFTAPLPGRAITVTAHVFAKDGKPYLHYVHHILATIQTMPQRLFWLNSLRGVAKGADPFDAIATIKADIRRSLQVNDEVIDSMLRQVEANSRFRKTFTNTVRLAGFIGPKAFVAAPGDDEPPHIHLLLKQYPDLAAALPIDITGVDASFGPRLRANLPVAVFAQVRVTHDTENHACIRLVSDWKGVAQAPAAAFSGNHWPAWAVEAFKAYHEERLAASHATHEPQANGAADPTAADVAGGAVSANARDFIDSLNAASPQAEVPPSAA